MIENKIIFTGPVGVGKTTAPAALPKASESQGTPSRALPAVTAEAVNTAASSGTTMPDFRGMSMRQVLKVMEKRQLNIQIRGSGRVVAQYPQPGSVIKSSDSIWVKLESGI